MLFDSTHLRWFAVDRENPHSTWVRCKFVKEKALLIAISSQEKCIVKSRLKIKLIIDASVRFVSFFLCCVCLCGNESFGIISAAQAIFYRKTCVYVIYSYSILNKSAITVRMVQFSHRVTTIYETETHSQHYNFF